MTTEFDPRPWNLATGLAGLALLSASCGGRTISGDSNASSTDTNTSDASTGDTDSSGTETGGECVTNADCPPGPYYCQFGYCNYEGYVDGHNWYQCYSDGECNLLELCDNSYCEPVESPAACGASMGDVAIPLSFDGAALALVFADLDADGQRELVVATQADLHVFEAGVDTPTTSPRVMNSANIDAAAAGLLDLDANPGEDVVLLVDDALLLHSSDGVSGFFAGPSVSPSMVGAGFGLRAGDLDGQAPTELVVFGEQGALIDHGGGDVTPLSMLEVRAAAVRDQGLPGAGSLVRDGTGLRFFDAAGMLVAVEQPAGSDGGLGPVALYMTGGTPHNTSSSRLTDWTLMELWGAQGGKQAQWGVEFELVEIAVGDLDGDGDDELILLDDAGGLWLYRPDSGAGCVRALNLGAPVSGVALGDHDGDGDDELAIRFGTGEAAIVTVG